MNKFEMVLRLRKSPRITEIEPRETGLWTYLGCLAVLKLSQIQQERIFFVHPEIKPFMLAAANVRMSSWYDANPYSISLRLKSDPTIVEEIKKTVEALERMNYYQHRDLVWDLAGIKMSKRGIFIPHHSNESELNYFTEDELDTLKRWTDSLLKDPKGFYGDYYGSYLYLIEMSVEEEEEEYVDDEGNMFAPSFDRCCNDGSCVSCRNAGDPAFDQARYR